MKTMDKVIKALSICKNADINRSCKDCPMPDTHECMGILMTDALHYLKMFRDMTCGTSQKLRNTSQITCPKCHSEFVILPEANNPLSWEQLKRMTGRPVWVEEYWAPMEDEAGVTEDEGDTEAYWAILTYADEKRISVVNGRVDQFLHKDIWNNHEVSHSWQAYRKER